MESRHKLRNESAFKSWGNEEPLSLELPEEIEPSNTTALATEVHVGHLDLMHSAQATSTELHPIVTMGTVR